MKKGERRQEQGGLNWLDGMGDLLKGGVLAGITALVFLLICAFLVSAGVVGERWMSGMVLVGCIAGSFTGGMYVVRRNPAQLLLRGAATGIVMFLILLTSGVIAFGAVSMSRGGAVLLGAVCGGMLSALTAKRQKKKRRKK